MLDYCHAAPRRQPAKAVSHRVIGDLVLPRRGSDEYGTIGAAIFAAIHVDTPRVGKPIMLIVS